MDDRMLEKGRSPTEWRIVKLSATAPRGTPCWRPVAEHLPRSVVDEGEDLAGPLPVHLGEVHPLREELPDEPVRVLDRALLPGAVRPEEVELRAPRASR